MFLLLPYFFFSSHYNIQMSTAAKKKKRGRGRPKLTKTQKKTNARVRSKQSKNWISFKQARELERWIKAKCKGENKSHPCHDVVKCGMPWRSIEARNRIKCRLDRHRRSESDYKRFFGARKPGPEKVYPPSHAYNATYKPRKKRTIKKKK